MPGQCVANICRQGFQWPLELFPTKASLEKSLLARSWHHSRSHAVIPSLQVMHLSPTGRFEATLHRIPSVSSQIISAVSSGVPASLLTCCNWSPGI
mmetsp:Transcript_37161/g.73599  ORF Transcript_37161/g.73599 Transcript_37161/m.73599 type:complete len:96 (+) Transcript_37161:1260-1547(+)